MVFLNKKAYRGKCKGRLNINFLLLCYLDWSYFSCTSVVTLGDVDSILSARILDEVSSVVYRTSFLQNMHSVCTIKSLIGSIPTKQ